MAERTIVYANRTCQPQVYAAVPCLDAETVRTICEYLPAEGRKFIVSEIRGGAVCDECFRSRSESISVHLLLLSPMYKIWWETPMLFYLCRRCSSMADYEMMLERGICAIRGRYYVDGEHTLRVDYYRLFNRGGLATLKHGVALADDQHSILSCRAVYAYKTNARTYFLTKDIYDYAITVWSGSHQIWADASSLLPIRSEIRFF